MKTGYIFTAQLKGKGKISLKQAEDDGLSINQGQLKIIGLDLSSVLENLKKEFPDLEVTALTRQSEVLIND